MDGFHFISPDRPDLLSVSIPSARLQSVSISDRFQQDIFREFTDEITRYVLPSTPTDLGEIHDFIVTSRNEMEQSSNLLLAILSKSFGQFIGCCGLHGQENIKTPELGIWIKRSSHGNGYGREAITTLVDWASRIIELDYFIYPVERQNIASCKIPISLGGIEIGDLKVETPTGKILDKIIYKISPKLDN